jgi:hypothetical protein
VGGAVIDVSVIIPSRNRRPFVTETLDLLARQTYPAARTEVVVVDDGSSDDTASAVKGRSYPFKLRYLRLEPPDEIFWAARPRNAGLRAAGGEVSIFIDSDVFVNAGFVEAHIKLHGAGGPSSRPRVGIGHIYGAAFDNEDRTANALKPPSIDELAQFIQAEQRPPPGWKEGRTEYAATWPDLRRCPIPWNLFWTGNVSFPTQAILRAGGFDEEFRGWGGEDTDLGYRLFRTGVEFHWVEQAWGVHYPHGVRAGLDEEARRNCRQILKKFPDSIVEAVLWSLRFAEPGDIPEGVPVGSWRVRVVQEIEKARRAYLECPADPRLPPALVAELRSAHESDGGRPLLWLGPRPEGLGEPGERLVCSDAFGPEPDGAAGAPPIGAGWPPRLIGLASPWPDRSFALAVAAHYWAALPPSYLRPMVRELSRLAPVVALVLPERAEFTTAIEQTNALFPSAVRRSFAGTEAAPATLVWEIRAATPDPGP